MNKRPLLLFMLLTAIIIAFAAFEKSKDKLLEVCSELELTEILLVERQAIYSSHVYTYHEEDNKPGGGLYIYNLKSEALKKILDSKEGLILDANVHYNGLPDSIKKGSIKKLAIVQEVEKPLGINPDRRAFGFQFPVVSADATYAPKKIWGLQQHLKIWPPKNASPVTRKKTA